MSNPHELEVPVACDLSAIPGPAREQHLLSTVPAVFGAVVEARMLPDGLEFRLPPTPGQMLAVARFVEHERLCCPFFHFAIEVEPASGPIWLRLTGPEGTQRMLLEMVGALLPVGLAIG